jgi:hypothetical protein
MNELTYSELLELAKKARITLEVKIAKLEKERDELKVVVSYLDAKITSASNCHERATPILLSEALERTHLDFHRKTLKESK